MLIAHTTNVVANDMMSTSVCFCNPSCKFNIHLKCVGGLFGKQNIGPLICKCYKSFLDTPLKFQCTFQNTFEK
jgi:hypothetical protein